MFRPLAPDPLAPEGLRGSPMDGFVTRTVAGFGSGHY
jgi:hypothetical protein